MRTDVDRDGRINEADAGCQLAGTPFRFWYNEDVDKGDYIGQWPDVRPNWEADPNQARVKGKLDLRCCRLCGVSSNEVSAIQFPRISG